MGLILKFQLQNIILATLLRLEQITQKSTGIELKLLKSRLIL